MTPRLIFKFTLFLFAILPTLFAQAQFTDISAGLTGVGDASIAWGDYDGDGDLDLLATGLAATGAKTTLYRNNGGSFSAVANLPFIHVSLGEVAWGDYDNDGDPDLLLTGQKNDGAATTQMYRNNGNGTFTDINAGITAVKASMADWGDFDNDGDLDFFIAGVGTDDITITKVYRNNGNGTFSAISAGLKGLRRGDGKWVDYDKDGDLDLLLTGRDTQNVRWTILYRNSNGVFTDSGVNFADVDLSGVDWADFDGDGYEEVLIAGTSNSGPITRLYDNPAQTGGSATQLTTFDGVEFAAASWGDYDNDGYREIAIMGRNANNTAYTRLYNWTGGTSFSDVGADFIGLYKGSLDWGDFDNDGDLDLAVAGFNAIETPFARIYRNSSTSDNSSPDPPFNLTAWKAGSTVFLKWGEALDDHTPIELLTANLRVGTTPGGSNIVAPSSTGDGNMGTGNNYQLQNLANGTYYWSIQTVDASFARSEYAFEQAFFIGDDQFAKMNANMPSDARRVGWADLDNDGDLDAIFTGNQTSAGPPLTKIYRNTNGQFSDMGVSLPQVLDGLIQVSDVDNDNDLDLILQGDQTAGFDGQGLVSGLYLNQSGSFTDAGVAIGFSQFCSQEYPSVITGDVDNNGFPDLIHPSIGSDVDSQIGVRLNQDGLFNAIFEPWGQNLNAGTLVAGDFTNDGQIDIFTAGLDNSQCNGPIARTLVNKGDHFESFSPGAYSGYNGIPALGDYDADGNLDLMTSGYMFGQDDPGVTGNFAGIYRNTGNGFALAAEVLPFKNTQFSASKWGDYDMDGDLDLLFTGVEGSPLYENRNGAFVQIAGAFDEIFDIDAAWGDYDGDGDLDVLITGITNGVPGAYLFSNTRSAKNDEPIAPTNPFSTVSSSNVTLSWNASNDEETPAKGLSYNIRVGTTPGGSDAMSASARDDGRPLAPRFGLVHDNRSFTLKGLEDGAYFWSVQAIDGGFKGSPFAAEQSFIIGTPIQNGFIDSGITFIGIEEGAAAWGDFDNDNDLDLLVAGTTNAGAFTRLYRNTGSTLVDAGFNFTPINFAALDWGDYNNDGLLDFILTGRGADGSHNTLLFRNTGFGFEEIDTDLPGLLAGAADWGDFDNDGDLDLLLTGRLSNLDNFAGVFKNVNGIFTNINAGLTGIRRGQASWVDYDVDGDLDILLTGRINDAVTRRTLLYRNTGGVFEEISDGLPDVDLSSINWGDYDNDGDPDLLLAGRRASGLLTQVYRNNTGSFTDIGAGLPVLEFADVRWGDYDNDGDLDILLSGRSLGVKPLTAVYRNDGGVFTDLGAGMTGVAKSAVAWGDFDKDGDLDAFITGQVNDTERVGKLYKNTATTANTAPSPPAGLTHEVGPDYLRLSWGQGSDGQTPQNGLSYNLRVGTAPGGSDVIAPHSLDNGWQQLAGVGNVQQNRSWKIKPLAPGLYYWSVQSVDHGFAGSAFATEQRFLLTDPVLPVELTDFEARYVESRVLLTWRTAGETNNAGFEVQRALDGEAFVRIGFVDGEGTTADAQAYSYEDASAPYGNGTLHYRLKQIDFDGGFAYSMIVNVERNAPNAVILMPNYPNPFNPTTEIRYEVPADMRVHLAVYDLTGKKVATLTDQVQAAGRYRILFDASHLASGVYIYRLETPVEAVFRQLVLLK